MTTIAVVENSFFMTNLPSFEVVWKLPTPYLFSLTHEVNLFTDNLCWPSQKGAFPANLLIRNAGGHQFPEVEGAPAPCELIKAFAMSAIGGKADIA
jgi:hypothetical protein